MPTSMNNNLACKPPESPPKSAGGGMFVTKSEGKLMELTVLWGNDAVPAGSRILIPARPLDSFELHNAFGSDFVLIQQTQVVVVEVKCKHCDKFTYACGSCWRSRG